MTIKLRSEEIERYWDYIKYATLTVVPQKDVGAYCRELAIKLLSGKVQAWLYVEDRAIHTVILTRLMEGVGSDKHVLIDAVYGFKPITDKTEFMSKMVLFGRNTGAKTVTAFTSNQMASNAALHAGMSKVADMFQITVGG